MQQKGSFDRKSYLSAPLRDKLAVWSMVAGSMPHTLAATARVLVLQTLALQHDNVRGLKHIAGTAKEIRNGTVVLFFGHTSTKTLARTMWLSLSFLNPICC